MCSGLILLECVMSFVSSLNLYNFRSYGQAQLKGLSSGLVVLYGANGAGKTNVLEALSLLAPGRGLRGARNTEIQSRNDGGAWAVNAAVQDGIVDVKIGTGLDPQSDKRVVRIDGHAVRGQAALAEHMACVWLTPQMDRLFLDSSSHRRKFFDRLVFAFDPGHAGRVNRYDNAMSQRSKILRQAQQKGGVADTTWLDGLEAQMAETGVAIAAARRSFVERLQMACDRSDNDVFPLAQLQLRGTIEELLAQVSALEVEEMFRYQLTQSREKDGYTGGAASGPHKADLLVSYAEKSMPAAQCSTGEQKALLIGIVMAHAKLITAERGVPPLLLLDEVAAHLDESRRGILYEMLRDLGGQVWLTGTDENLFSSVRGSAKFLEVRDGLVSPLPLVGATNLSRPVLAD